MTVYYADQLIRRRPDRTMHSLICRPKRTTDATVDRTMAAAAENPFMMLSVYFTTTDVYIPPTLARTAGRKQREKPVKPLERHSHLQWEL